MSRPKPTPVSPVDARRQRLASRAAVSVAASLVILKFGAWMATDSVSLLSTLVDSALDLGASTLNLMAVRQALTPADAEHRFGHGKAEAIAALAQSAFIAGSALFLLAQSARRLITPVAIEHSAVGLAVMVVSIGATLALVRYQRGVARDTRSLAIAADALHYVGDVGANAAVIVALLCTEYLGWLRVDPLIGIGIGLYIAVNAYAIGKGALDMLMDHELPDEERQRIKSIVLRRPEVRAMHALRVVELIEGARLHQRRGHRLVHASQIHAPAEVEEIEEGLLLAVLAVARLEDRLQRGLAHALDAAEAEADLRLQRIA